MSLMSHRLLGKLGLAAVIAITATQTAPATKIAGTTIDTSWEKVIVAAATPVTMPQNPQAQKKRDAYLQMWNMTSWSRTFNTRYTAPPSSTNAGGGGGTTANSNGGNPEPPVTIYGPGWVPTGIVPPPISIFLP